MGSFVMTIEATRVFRPFVDPGATVMSETDGDLSKYIFTTGVNLVRHDRLGTYIIQYNVKSLNGLLSAATVRRTVNVLDSDHFDWCIKHSSSSARYIC